MLFLSAALSLLSALVRRERRQLVLTARDRRKKVRVAPRRIAASLAFATLFFAGAALSAGAGNGVVQADRPGERVRRHGGHDHDHDHDHHFGYADPADPNDDRDRRPADCASRPRAAERSPRRWLDGADRASLQRPRASLRTARPRTRTSPASARRSGRGSMPGSGSRASASSHSARPGSAQMVPARLLRPQVPPVVKAMKVAPLRKAVEREPEADEPNVAATVWLYRDLPDPTPPSRRLKPAFARQLARVSKRNHVDWALTLAVLRARGPWCRAGLRAQLRTLTTRLARQGAKRDAWGSVLSLEGRTSFADRTIALKNLYRAVGLKALVKGFDWDKPRLEKQILNDKRITIYPGGRSDVENHRVNVRVLAMIAYLAEAHGQVTVSCLISGHRLYARPGVISAHIYGLAADISELGGVPILGHQQPDGSITERGVRNILLLPAEMQPRQVISLLGLGGPSFPLANHYDHIHVGY